MATLIKEVRLIKVEQTDDVNSYKYWNAQLFDDGNVHAEWARVGAANPASGDWNGGESYLDKKVREKLKKGYVEQKTVGTANTGSMSTVKVDSNLREIAKKELLKDASNTVLAGLVDRLVKSNIHKITATTNITFNNTTGLFTTPLGIVTPDGISEARDILAQIHPLVKASRFTSTLNDYVNKYVLIVPQNLGMKRFNAETVFPDESAVQKQEDILQSLEASYQAMTSTPTTSKSKPTESGVFKVDLDVERGNEAARLEKWYESSKKSMHGYGNVKVRNVFKIKIHDMDRIFLHNDSNKKEVWHGSGMGNVLSILKSGLKIRPPATAAIAGALFGAGIYGAISSTKSLGYSLGRWQQSGLGDSAWLFVADFALGNCYSTTSYGCSKPSGYDSIWAKSSSNGLHNDELIVYRENRVNLKYLLECK
jgi:poly [ADP-ribose] polymerase